MGRRADYPKPLTLAFVRRVQEPGRYYDDDGLILTVSPSGAKRWLHRVTIAGRRSDLSLGSAHVVTPAQARKAAARQKAFVRKGGDPRSGTIAPRRSETIRSPMKFSRFLKYRYEEIYEDSTIEKARTNYGSLRLHATPTIGKMALRDIETGHIETILTRAVVQSPGRVQWLRQNLIRVFNAAIQEGHITVNPARAIKSADLPSAESAREDGAPSKSDDVLSRLPEIYGQVMAESDVSATMLMTRFCLLTARQPSECRLAKWSDISHDRTTWTIPSPEDGSAPVSKVPLHDEMRDALVLADRLIRARDDGYVFTSPQGVNKPISINAPSVLLRRRGIRLQLRDIAIAFRTWSAATGNDDLTAWVAFLTHQAPTDATPGHSDPL